MLCDEGVFRIVLSIYLKKQDKLSNMIPMLGGFHMAKCVLHCIGNVLIETGVFGAKVLEATLTGTRYVRSFRGMLILFSAISSLKWSAFSETINHDQFNEINVN